MSDKIRVCVKQACHLKLTVPVTDQTPAAGPALSPGEVLDVVGIERTREGFFFVVLYCAGTYLLSSAFCNKVQIGSEL